jgi:cephalosporin hydroxylase
MTIELLKFMIDLTMQNKEDIDEHILTLFALTLSMKPKKIIELGVRTARSTLPFLYGCQIIGADLISVDINNISPFMEFPQEWQNNWTFIKKDALKFLEEDFPNIWTDEGNIVYIDDWHDGDHVKKELELIDKFVSPRDLILLHDLMYGNSQPNYRSVEENSDKQWDNGGPYKAISQLDLNKWEYVTIPRCHGLTLLRKKSSTVITE